MTTPERSEAIKVLGQLATMYHMNSPNFSNKADPNAIRLRNRAAVLQLSTHANVTEDEAAEKYYQQQAILEQQRRREIEMESRRNATNGVVVNDTFTSGSFGQGGSLVSPVSNSSFRRHYATRRLDGSPNGSFALGSPNALSPNSQLGGAGANNVGSVFPPPPVRRDSAIGAVESLVTLANSYASTGRFTDAVRVIKRAIAFAENQFKPREIEGQRTRMLNVHKFRKSNTLTSQSSTAPTVSSIHDEQQGGEHAGEAKGAGSPASPRRVGFVDDKTNANGSVNAYSVEALKGVYDNNASFGHDEATNTLTNGASSPFFSAALAAPDNDAYINQPQLVPLLLLLSNYLDAEGSRHEAQCTRDRIRAITENIQGIGILDTTYGKTNVKNDIEAMETILTPVGDQFSDREALLEMASPEHRRAMAEELLRQRTGGDTSGTIYSRTNTGGNLSNASRLSIGLGGSSPHSPARRSGSYSASRTRGTGDASPGSVAYVRGKNFYKYQL